MVVLVDLRYLVPPLINLLKLQAKSWAQDSNSSNPIFFVMAFLFVAIAILLFLFTSVKLPLTLSVEPIRLRAGHFSSPLTLALLASLFLPSSLFWYIFPILVILSPWYEILLNLLKRFMLWFCHTLQANIPTLTITCIPQHHQDEHEAIFVPQDEAELEAITVIEESNEANIYMTS
jgi:hypothetical protein